MGVTNRLKYCPSVNDAAMVAQQERAPTCTLGGSIERVDAYEVRRG